MLITNQTKLNMVIGYPLTHTKSPLLHNTVYEALNINAVLLAFPHESVASLISSIKTLSVGLTAVTMPFKEAVLPYLDVRNPEVDALKAVNTLIQTEGHLKGFNTDVDGIEFALRDVAIKSKNVLLMGAGGAARAAAYLLQKKKANIFWFNRTVERAKKLSKEFGGEILDQKEIETKTFDIIIHTTPLGMYPDQDKTPLPDYPFQKNQVVFDMVYNPLHTKLLIDAKSKGAKIISGLEMFIGQGLRQIELWTEQTFMNDNLLKKIKTVLTR